MKKRTICKGGKLVQPYKELYMSKINDEMAHYYPYMIDTKYSIEKQTHHSLLTFINILYSVCKTFGETKCLTS